MNPSHYQFIVADDDERARFLIEFALKRAFPNATLHSCSDGEDALRCFKESGADAVITDQSMPRLTGSDLTIEIRRLNPAVPIVMVSNSPFAKKDGLAAGANCYVDKGRALESLPRIVQELLSSHSTARRTSAGLRSCSSRMLATFRKHSRQPSARHA